jgi:regulator of sigma E protease
MNYVFAVAALAAFFMTVGLYVFPPKLAEVIKDGPAAVAGIEAGDLITAVNGTPIVDFAELKNIIVLSYKEDVVITVERGGQKLDFVVRPEMQDGTPLIGVVAVSAAAELTHDRLGPIAAISRAVNDTYTVTAGTLKYVKQIIFAGRSAKEMRGPLGIAEASGDAAKGGALSLILFIVQVSIAVGLINLFPIPMMDGGHLLLYLIEAMRGKALSAKVQSVIMKIGFLFIMALFGYTMLNDIPRIWERLWS